MSTERKGPLELFTVIKYKSKKTGNDAKMLKLSGSQPNKNGEFYKHGVKQITVELHSGEKLVLNGDTALFPTTPEEKINTRLERDKNFTEEQADRQREAMRAIAAIYELPAQK